MYFVIMLLLLLVSDFINSMDSSGTQQEEQLIPFNYEFTERLSFFLENKLNTFNLNLRTRVIMELISIINGFTDLNTYFLDLCDTDEISSPSGYHITQESTIQCRSTCNTANVKYVAFLNASISQVKEKFLGKNASRGHIKLNAINVNTDKCVKIKPKIFECQCNPNYQIMISKFLKQLVERTVDTATNTPACTTQEKFIIFVLLLKFFPYNAPLYFTYLIDNEGIFLERFTYEVPDVSDPSVLNTNILVEQGGIVDIGTFIESDKCLFRKLLENIKCDKCNLKKFGNVHFSNIDPSLMFFVLVIMFKKLYQLITSPSDPDFTDLL